MTTRRLAAMLVVAALVVSACGKSSGSPAASGAGGSSDINVPQMPAAGGGSCTVNLTGDVSKSWTSTQTVGSLLISYWLSSAEAAVLSLSDNEAYFILNCQGSGGTVSFMLTNDTTKAQFPEAPGTYTIPAASGLVGLGGDPGKVGVLLSLNDNAIWNVTEPGTFKITTFGGGKFAGTFEAKLGKIGDDLKTVTATANLSGSFDMSCTSRGCN